MVLRQLEALIQKALLRRDIIEIAAISAMPAPYWSALQFANMDLHVLTTYITKHGFICVHAVSAA